MVGFIPASLVDDKISRRCYRVAVLEYYLRLKAPLNRSFNSLAIIRQFLFIGEFRMPFSLSDLLAALSDD